MIFVDIVNNTITTTYNNMLGMEMHTCVRVVVGSGRGGGWD